MPQPLQVLAAAPAVPQAAKRVIRGNIGAVDALPTAMVLTLACIGARRNPVRQDEEARQTGSSRAVCSQRGRRQSLPDAVVLTVAAVALKVPAKLRYAALESSKCRPSGMKLTRAAVIALQLSAGHCMQYEVLPDAAVHRTHLLQARALLIAPTVDSEFLLMSGRLTTDTAATLIAHLPERMRLTVQLQLAATHTNAGIHHTYDVLAFGCLWFGVVSRLKGSIIRTSVIVIVETPIGMCRVT